MAAEYFATYQMVQTFGNIPKVSQEKIEAHFPMAKIDVVNIIGQETYAEMIANDTSDDFKRIQIAECYLTLKYLIPALNIESTGGGVTKATGFGDNRKENLSEFELEKIIGRYDDNAMKLLNAYAKSIDEDGDGAQDLVRVQGFSMACISDEEEC